jgi:RNA polymerase sigma-70 factor, ECF subfamily
MRALMPVSATGPLGVTGSYLRYRRSVANDGFRERLEAARQGSEQAWSELYEGFAPVVLGYLRANGAPEPEDVTGEVFLQVARDVHGFDGDERRFRAWVFTIVHHRLIDARRRHTRRPVDLVAEPPEPDRPPAGDVAEEALARIGEEEFLRVLKALSQDQRAVLLLRVLGDLTVAEVAEAIGKRPGAVKALQRRGLAAIQRELARVGVPI